MYTREQYEQAIELRKKGLKYFEITRKLGLKTTNAVIGWTKKEQLPKGRFLNSNFNRLSKELGYILGVIEGDGYIGLNETKGHIGLTVKDKDFALYFKKQLEFWSGIPVTFRQRKDTKHYVTTLFSLRAAQFLKNFDISILKKSNNKIKGAFLKGFFDAEGCIKIIREPVRRIAKICPDICCTNYDYIELCRKLLYEHLSIEARYSNQIPKETWKSNNIKKVYHLRIYRKEFVKKFLVNIKTIKLSSKKAEYVKNWFENVDKKEIITI